MQDTIRYEMVGNERALEYYYLDPSSGLITIKKLITEGEQTDDTVSAARCWVFFHAERVCRRFGRQTERNERTLNFHAGSVHCPVMKSC